MCTQKLVLPIRGLDCAARVPGIEHTLRRIEGVIWATVNFAASEAVILYDQSTCIATKLVLAMHTLGYDVDLPGIDARVRNFGFSNPDGGTSASAR
jgi:P-type Cu+ transporter